LGRQTNDDNEVSNASWVKAGIVAGIAFSVVGIAFVTVSLFTDISRSTWVVLDNAKGAIGFGFCGLAGVLIGRRQNRAVFSAAAGGLGGLIAGITVPVSMYVLAYGFVDSVRQYPFEYYDYLRSGASNVQAFLLSANGHETVRGTSLGLVPIVVIWAVTLGAAMGYLGGRIGRRWPGAAATTRPNKPLQPTSGADSSALRCTIPSAARG
jgi:hypothetical protein